ncbi:interferon gamma receptor 1 [Embiotoca jacksoni]|uniref:interferon gamma receptor 1 n=1 Tax=Embiotoca jacksoni TaxID=100190 RepID=UPI0037039C9D
MLRTLLLIGGVSAVFVPPPTNLTLSCQNLQTTVRWDYSKQHPETRFRVNIIAFSSLDEAETTDHHYDLSHFVWKSEHYMDYLYVTVTAVQGGNESAAVTSNSLSFNYLKTVHTTCYLDFPRVDVSVEKNRTAVTFRNPVRFYKELNGLLIKTPHDNNRFKFTVSLVGDDTSRPEHFEGSCTFKESTCKLDVFPKGRTVCVTLKGWLFTEEGRKQLEFRETDRIFYSGSVGGVQEVVLAIILLSVLVLVVVLSVIAICWTKAWDWTEQPNNLKVVKHKDPPPKYHPVDISRVFVPENRNDRSSSGSSDQESMSGGDGVDSEKTECVWMESEGGEEECEGEDGELEGEGREDPAYEPRAVVLQDMGDGDLVTVYSER